MKDVMTTAAWQVSLLLCALLLSACIAGPGGSTLYTLQPVTHQPLGSEFAGFQDMILLLPVRLAPPLQGRNLVSRRSSTESRSAAGHFWAGPLDQMIAGTMVRNLKDLLGTENIAVYPGPRFGTTRYQVEIEINEFSGDGQSFLTQAVYTLSDTAAKSVLARKSFRESRVIDKPDYSGYAASGSEAIAALSREVAAALRTARSATPTPESLP